MMQFKGFKPEAMKKIQGSLGFQGYAEDFDKYLEDNPDKKSTIFISGILLRKANPPLGILNGPSTSPVAILVVLFVANVSIRFMLKLVTVCAALLLNFN